MLATHMYSLWKVNKLYIHDMWIYLYILYLILKDFLKFLKPQETDLHIS